MLSNLSSCRILMTTEFSENIFKKCSKLKFHENLCSTSQAVPTGWMDRYDVLIVAFWNFGKVPQEEIKFCTLLHKTKISSYTKRMTNEWMVWNKLKNIMNTMKQSSLSAGVCMPPLMAQDQSPAALLWLCAPRVRLYSTDSSAGNFALRGNLGSQTPQWALPTNLHMLQQHK
jgi:hypothetical protein